MAKSKKKEPDELDELIDRLANDKSGKDHWYRLQLTDVEMGRVLLGLAPDRQAKAVARLVERLASIDARLREMQEAAQSVGLHPAQGEDRAQWTQLLDQRSPLELCTRSLLNRRLPLPEKIVINLLRWIRLAPFQGVMWMPYSGIASAVEYLVAGKPLSDGITVAIVEAAEHIYSTTENKKEDHEPRKFSVRLTRLTRLPLPKEVKARIDPGEAWSDAACTDLAAMDKAQRSGWNALLAACQKGGAGKPTAKWLKVVEPLMQAVGRDEIRKYVCRWLPLVDKPRTQPYPYRPHDDQFIEPHHVELLKGLAWCAGLEADRDLARALAGLALSAYRKIPGTGPRLISLGHAAVAGLGMMPGMDAVGQLAILKLKIKFIPAQKMAEKALNQAAEREGLPREEIDELAVPTYGMEEVGRRVETFGDYTAEIVVDGPDAHLRWSKAGKPIKSVPAALKKEHAEEVKELQAAVKDVGKMLTAQRERIDGLFLSRKSWPFAAWRERYLNHPLVGGIARRLIWDFEIDGKPVAGVWLKDGIVGVDDAAIERLGDSTMVSLWHPIDRTVEEVSAWRDWFERHQVRQPFKQAYREVYVLTDAERNTRVYSNRFAAHILRQHQYHALCAARGWRNRLRMMVDDSYPPTSRDLPEWGLRAEFWVEGIGDNMTDSGAYAYLNTDQVRFYEIAAPQVEAHAGGGGYSAGWRQAQAEPVPLDRIPPLVLSEVFRDVDLFVGVASVGNDPNWSDGGPQGRHVDYWQNYSFGDLNANGKTRRDVLERLIPRLKIAPRCSFSDKFLVVRGDIRTYKIHLGSGNILMEPNDQYLCIVPKRSTPEPQGVFLPFEGDNVLSIILSKALMLADDRKITDSTITSQIGGK